jgi:hypothetical protein
MYYGVTRRCGAMEISISALPITTIVLHNELLPYYNLYTVYESNIQISTSEIQCSNRTKRLRDAHRSAQFPCLSQITSHRRTSTAKSGQIQNYFFWSHHRELDRAAAFQWLHGYSPPIYSALLRRVQRSTEYDRERPFHILPEHTSYPHHA